MQTISKEESYTLSLIRVCAFICILTCHVCGAIPQVVSLEKVFDVGNSIFFLLSGYLIGIKGISVPGTWIKKKLSRILPQYYIMAAVLCLLFPQKLTVRSILASALNLQGFAQFYLPYSPHLWFISVMMIFYFLAPFFEKLVNQKQNCQTFIVLEICLLVFSFVNCLLWRNYALLDLSNYSIYFCLFLLGMRLGKYWDRRIKRNFYAVLTSIMVLLNAIRLVLIVYTNQGCTELMENLYIHFYASVSQAVFAFWISTTLYLLCMRFFKTLYQLHCAVAFLDKISYEIYLVHKPLLYGSWCLVAITPWLPLNLIIFAVVSVFLALILNKMSNKLKILAVLNNI